MRSIINISLPPNLAREVRREVKKGDYASTSEFFRQLLRSWKYQQLLADIKASRREFASGKGVILKSWDDLDK
ncbi:MAG: ribbon-helix-helix domain-containing protein [Candidatus Paceibacterota bacterium]|jgi:Arc/MetJ-type ribon-helix-helix transcriptional regulator